MLNRRLRLSDYFSTFLNFFVLYSINVLIKLYIESQFHKIFSHLLLKKKEQTNIDILSLFLYKNKVMK